MSDYDQICALIDQLDSLHRDNLPHILQTCEGPVRPREFLASAIDGEDQEILVTEADCGLIGLAHVRLIDKAQEGPWFVPRTFASIDLLVVDRDHRRQGIARALMDTVHSWAKERGAQTAELNVWAFNKNAQALYKSLGYEPVNIRMSRLL